MASSRRLSSCGGRRLVRRSCGVYGADRLRRHQACAPGASGVSPTISRGAALGRAASQSVDARAQGRIVRAAVERAGRAGGHVSQEADPGAQGAGRADHLPVVCHRHERQPPEDGLLLVLLPLLPPLVPYIGVTVNTC